MKPVALLLVCAAAFTVGNIAHSQAPAAPKTSVQRLEEIRAKNKELIERQTATLKQLEEIQLQAQQIKLLGKRS